MTHSTCYTHHTHPRGGALLLVSCACTFAGMTALLATFLEDLESGVTSSEMAELILSSLFSVCGKEFNIVLLSEPTYWIRTPCRLFGCQSRYLLRHSILTGCEFLIYRSIVCPLNHCAMRPPGYLAPDSIHCVFTSEANGPENNCFDLTCCCILACC